MPASVTDLVMPDFSDKEIAALPIVSGGGVHTVPRGARPWKDKDGRLWTIGVGGKGAWVRERKYRIADPVECELGDGHEVKPTRWPPPQREFYVGPAKFTEAGTMSLLCEHCGVNVIVDEAMLRKIQDGELAGYRITLPQEKK
jgi:hypothetical protein